MEDPLYVAYVLDGLTQYTSLPPAALRPGAGSSGLPAQRMTTTGQCAWVTHCCETEPSSRPTKPP
jgi:hypothetical protein